MTGLGPKESDLAHGRVTAHRKRMTGMCRIGLLLLLTWTFAGALAQTYGPYRLQPEDIVSIRVYGEQEMNVDAPVGLDGNIGVPFLGFIKAAGRTPGELENFVRTQLIELKYFRDPKVSVNIIRFRTLKANVIGFTLKPGQYEFKPGDRLLTLIAQAGGPIPDASDLSRATLVHKDTMEQIPIDLQAMLERGDLSQNYELQDGDVITIPERKIRYINIIGYVQRPQRADWKQGMTLADVLALAGGEVPYKSKLSKVQVQRQIPGRVGEYKLITIDFTRFTAKNDYTQNIEMMPGDVVFVPASNTDLNRAIDLASVALAVQNLLGRTFRIFPRT